MKLPRFELDDETKRALDETMQKAESGKERVLGVIDGILQPRLVLPLFLGVLLLLSIISAVVVAKEHREAAATEPMLSTEAAPDATDAKVRGALQGNFLLAFANGENAVLRMLAVVQADSAQSSLRVRYVSPDERVEVNNLNGTMQQHYDKGGATELSWAVGACADCTIDRYVIVNNDRFISFCKNLGEHELEIEAPVRAEYEGLSFVIESGRQTLTSDTLCKYFGYLCQSLYLGGDDKVTALLNYLAQSLISLESDTQLDRILAKLISQTTTNISAMDLQTYSAVRPAFCPDGTPVALVNEGVFRPAAQTAANEGN